MVKNLLLGAVLHNVAGVDDRHLVADLGHNAHVVGDQQHGGVVLFAQVGDQVQHLGLDGHIQRGGGLVGQQQVGVAGQRNGNDHTLLHAAGKLMRILIVPLRRDTHDLQHLLGALLGGGVALVVAVQPHHLGDLVADALHRVQGRHRVLKDHRDVVAADLAHLVLRQLQHILAFQVDLAARNAAAHVGQDAQDGFGNGGLAGAGLAHQAQGLAPLQMQRHAVDRVHHLAVGHILHHQVLHFEELGLFTHLAVPPLSSSASGPKRPAGRRPSGSGPAR